MVREETDRREKEGGVTRVVPKPDIREGKLQAIWNLRKNESERRNVKDEDDGAESIDKMD